jgi:subfamily B ATP-binding cassette protein MsbA
VKSVLKDRTTTSPTRDPEQGMAVYRRLLGYVRPYWGAFVVAVVAMAVMAATESGFAALMKPMLDGSFVARDRDVIRLIPFAILGLFVLRGVASFVSTYGMFWVGRKVIKALRGELFAHLLRLPAGFYHRHSAKTLLSKLIYDAEQVAYAATNAITIAVRDSLTVLGLLAWMLYLSPGLAAIFLLLGPIIAVLVVFVARRFRRISQRIQTSVGEVTRVAGETVDGVEVVKLFGGQPVQTAHFERANESNRQQTMRMVATSAVNTPLVQLIAAAALALVVYLVTLPEMLETITVGTFISFVAAMMLLLPPLKRLTNVNANLQKGIAAGQSLFAVLDEPPERDSGTRRLERATGRVELRGVSFAYDPAQGNVLEGVDLVAEPGQTVALVGRSGSGKSTLVHLLPRFHEPSRGAVLLDGLDTRELTLASLREQVALVSQQVVLFDASIADNIAYGRADRVARADVEAAAEAAHVMDFARRLPRGLDTPVGERGALLSGGQRQRVAIARALLKDAPVLILDEATSALDSESERQVQAALEALMGRRTTLVIAHRLSTVERAHRILVLDAGRIVESGTHAELLARGGQYAALYRMQFRDPGPADPDSDSDLG